MIFHKKRRIQKKTEKLVSQIYPQVSEMIRTRMDDPIVKKELQRLGDRMQTVDGMEKYTFDVSSLEETLDLCVSYRKEKDGIVVLLPYVKRINELLDRYIQEDDVSSEQLEDERNWFKSILEWSRKKHEEARLVEDLNILVETEVERNTATYYERASHYNSMKNELRRLRQELERLEKIQKANEYVSIQHKNQQAHQRAESFLSKTYEEALSLHNTVRASSEPMSENLKGYKELYEKDETYQDTDELLEDQFERALEENLLKKAQKLENETFNETLNKMSEETIEKEIQSLRALVETLQADVAEKHEELLDDIKETIMETIDWKLEKRKISGSLRDVVEALMNEFEPPEAMSAAARIRGEIEAWFRYERGMDMSSPQFKNMPVIERFKKVFSSKEAQMLHKIWKRANNYIHGDISKTISPIDEASKEELKQSFSSDLDGLAQLGIETDADPEKLKDLLKNEDEWLKKSLMELEYVDGTFRPAQKFNDIRYAVARQKDRWDYLKSLGIQPPKISLKTMNDIRSYALNPDHKKKHEESSLKFS